MSNFINRDNLYIGTPEINTMQDLLLGDISANADVTIRDYGLMLYRETLSTWNSDWLVSQTDRLGLSVNTGKAMVKDANGVTRGIIAKMPAEFSIADGEGHYAGGTHYILLEYAPVYTEAGTVSFSAASKSVVGIGTTFTKPLKQHRSIIIGNTDFAVDSVEDDTHLTLSANAGVTLNGQSFSIGGWFCGTQPSISNRIIYSHTGYNIIVTQSAKLPHQLILATIVADGEGIISITDSRSDNVMRLHSTEEYGAGTRSPIFRVGMGTGQGGLGYPVMLDMGLPPMPRNFHISDIRPSLLNNHVDGTVAGELAGAVRTGLISSDAFVILEWGWNNLHGTGGNGFFTIDSAIKEFFDGALTNIFAGDLAGMFIKIAGTNYAIVGNDAPVGATTKIYILTVNGEGADLTGVTASGQNYAIIHPNADSYQVVVVPYTTVAPIVRLNDERKEYSCSYQDEISGITRMLMGIAIPLGSVCDIQIRAIRNGIPSQYRLLQSGSFDKNTMFAPQSVNYCVPTVITMPQINAIGASIGAVGTRAGFIVTINGWALATDFEICYTTDGAGADFANDQHNRLITNNRRAEIATPSARTYSVSVRPLMGGQSVAPMLSARVTSGAAGIPPRSGIVSQVYVDIRTRVGLAKILTASVGSSPMVIKILSAQDPNHSAISYPTFGDELTGQGMSMFATVVMEDVTVGDADATLKVVNNAGFTDWAYIMVNGSVHHIPVTGKSGTNILYVRWGGIEPVMVKNGMVASANAFGWIPSRLLYIGDGCYKASLWFTPTTPPEAGTEFSFVIGCDQYSRTVVSQRFDMDYQLSEVTFDCDLVDGTSLLRWQSGNNSAGADSMAIAQSETPVSSPTDVKITSDDVYAYPYLSAYFSHPTNLAANLVEVCGTLTIYGQPADAVSLDATVS